MIFFIIVFEHETRLRTMNDGVKIYMRDIWAPCQHPIIRLIVESRKVSKAQDRVLKCSCRFEIWQAHRRQWCQGGVKFRSDRTIPYSNLAATRSYNKIRRLIRYQNRTLVVVAIWDFLYNINIIYVIVLKFIFAHDQLFTEVITLYLRWGPVS